MIILHACMKNILGCQHIWALITFNVINYFLIIIYINLNQTANYSNVSIIFLITFQLHYFSKLYLPSM